MFTHFKLGEKNNWKKNQYVMGNHKECVGMCRKWQNWRVVSKKMTREWFI